MGLHPAPASRSIIQAQTLRNQLTPSLTLEIDSLSALRKALEGGLGCSILARATVAGDLAEGRYGARRIVQPTPTRILHLVSLADRPQTRAFTEVKTLLSNIISGAVASGQWHAKPIARRRLRKAI